MQLPLMHDLLFKETFANVANRKQLERLIELLFDYPEGYLRNKLSVQYESPLQKNKLKQKSVRGDIIVEFDDTLINIEAYTKFDLNSINKSLYYITRIQANKLEIGEDYYQLGKTIQINFVDNSILNLGDKLVYNFHFACDELPEVKLSEEAVCVKIVQIDKAREIAYTKNKLEKWLKFIAEESYEEREKIAEGDDLLMELNDWIKKYVNDEETQEKLNKWDLQIAKNKGYEKGKEEGQAEGLQQGIEQGKAEGIAEGTKKTQFKIIQNMLNNNMDLKDISNITGISIEEIEEIKNQ